MPRGRGNTPEAEARMRNNLNKATRFVKGQSGNPLGRKRSTISSFVYEIEAMGYEVPTNEDIVKSWLAISAMPEAKIKEILTDVELPMQLRIIARGVLDKKGLDVVEKIVNRAYGTTQKIDLTTGGEKLSREPLKIEIIDRAEQVDKKEE
jgi:hypothetical protein